MAAVSGVSESDFGNTKRNRARAWCLTQFNYTDEHKIKLSQNFDYFVYGEEICPTTGSPHLQCYVANRNQISFTTMKKMFPTARISVAHGTMQQNLTYCSKEGNFKTNIRLKAPIRTIEVLRPWQQKIVDILNEQPEDRTIWWFWEPDGNTGKSALCKYLAVKRGSMIITTNKSADIATCIDEDCSEYIFDFPRSVEGFSPWNGLEQLKNGLITEAKLKKKAKTTIINNPHVIIFANWVPDKVPVTIDKLKIVRIKDDMEV